MTVSNSIQQVVRKFKTDKIKQTIENNRSLKVLRRRLSNGKFEIKKLKNDKGEISSNREELFDIAEKTYTELYKCRREKNKPKRSY